MCFKGIAHDKAYGQFYGQIKAIVLTHQFQIFSFLYQMHATSTGLAARAHDFRLGLHLVDYDY